MVMQQGCSKINAVISWGFFLLLLRGSATDRQLSGQQGQSAALIIRGSCLHAHRSDPLPLQVQRHTHIMELCKSLEQERVKKDGYKMLSLKIHNMFLMK